MGAPQIVRREAGGIGDYNDFSQTNSFTNISGVVVLPVASQGPAHRLIRLHGGYGIRTASWSAARTGKPPIIPAAVDTYEDTILGSSFSPSLPQATTNGGYNWSASGEYVYVQNTVRTPGRSAFPVGDFPFRVEPAMSRAESLVSSPPLQQYVNAFSNDQSTTPVQTLAGHLQNKTPLLDGEIQWPFLVFPSVFSSDHLIGG